MLVSVIIPTHSRPQLLERAVESARVAGSNVEIIVVDDASTDETAAVCRTFKNIKHVRLERNQGVAGARNVGILMSSGKYIAFLDDDDLRLPGSLDLQVAALDGSPQAALCCGAMIIADQNYQPTGEVIRPRHRGPDVFWELLELDFPVMPLSVLVRRDHLLSVGLLNRRLSGLDDWDIFTRLAELYSVVVLDESMGIYRQPTHLSGQGSSARAKQLRRAAHHQLQLLKLPRALAAPPAARREVRRRGLNRIADTLLWNAGQALNDHKSAPIAVNVLTALRLRPTRLARPRAYRKFASQFLEK